MRLKLPIKFCEVLLLRFTYPKNALPNLSGWISGLGDGCCLCQEYKICSKCPLFGSFQDTTLSCNILLEEIAGGINFTYSETGPLIWYMSKQTKVRKQFTKIRKFLRKEVEWTDEQT